MAKKPSKTTKTWSFDLRTALIGSKPSDDELRVDFDWYTPRPHYIILEKSPKYEFGRDKPLADRAFLTRVLGAAEQVVELVESARGSEGDDQPIVLSIHRGQWITSKQSSQIFHGHLCTDVESYLQVYDKVRRSGELSDRVLNPNYETTARAYAGKHNYCEEELADIDQGVAIPGVKALEDGEVLYHDKYARIGFPRISDRVELLMTMDKFAVDHELSTCAASETKNDHRGCHICVSVPTTRRSAQVFPGYGENREVYGYIKVTGPVVYQMMSGVGRASWLENFRLKEETVLT